MKIHCYKYQAAGNDFVLVDNRKGELSFTNEQISKICDRRFGIGGDGIILMEKATDHAFKMVYHNADGSVSFCGNGCRAIVHLANKLGFVGTSTSFLAHDGAHQAARLDLTPLDLPAMNRAFLQLRTGQARREIHRPR